MEEDKTESIETDEDREREDNPSPDAVKGWAVVALVLSLPVAAAVEHYYDPGRGRAAGVAFGLMILVGRAFWYLRRHLWFWLTVAALVIIHLVLVVAVSWTNKSFPAPELWPVGFADFAAMCGFIKLVEKLMRKSDPARHTG